jgi:hypothetical protein
MRIRHPRRGRRRPAQATAASSQDQSRPPVGAATGRHLCRAEQGEIGPDLFRAACDIDLWGLVSKRRDRPYQAGAGRRVGSRSRTRSIARWSEIVPSSTLLATGTNGAGLRREAGDADRSDERQRQGQSENANEQHGEGLLQEHERCS